MSTRSYQTRSQVGGVPPTTSNQPHAGDSDEDAPYVAASLNASQLNQEMPFADDEGDESDTPDNVEDGAETAEPLPTTNATRPRRYSHDGTMPVKQESPDDGSAKIVADAMAKAFADLFPKIKNEPTTSKGPQASAPDKFDGSKADKLRPFLAQLNIVFLNHPRRFPTERSKVLFAGSYLSGTAADWFEPIIEEGSKESLMLDNWVLFKERLTKVFGDPNAEATAEHNIELLVMKDSEAIAGYITRFRTEAARLKWDDAALRHKFRMGLAERILDELARVPEQPMHLSDLMEQALLIDNRHWERVRERKFRPTTRAVAERTSTPILRNSKNNRSSGRPYSENRDVRDNRTKRFTPTKPQNYKGKGQPSALDKILVNGKLTDAEKKRRAEKGLCSYCGLPHPLENCPSRPAQGRRAIADVTKN